MGLTKAEEYPATEGWAVPRGGDDSVWHYFRGAAIGTTSLCGRATARGDLRTSPWFPTPPRCQRCEDEFNRPEED